MKIRYFLALLAAVLTLSACDDDATILGVDMMPQTDALTNDYKEYDVNTESWAVGDRVLARTSMSYLGRFTDPETGTTIKSDFLSQFHCVEGRGVPENITDETPVSVNLRLYYDKFVGDSLTSFKVSVYELTKPLDPNEDLYTNINPEDYYEKDAEPLTSKWFTLSDRTISEDERNNSSYYPNINISIPAEKCAPIVKAWKEHPEYFKTSSSWFKSGLPLSKGLYVKLEQGDGALAYVYLSNLNIYFRYYDEEEKCDTLGLYTFSATEEVVQATRFENSNLETLLDNKEATYLKCPAGIFTMATIPAEQINSNDTINSAKIVFTRYNDKVESGFKLDIPKQVLMVRVDEYNDGFFEKYKVCDYKTSFTSTFNSSDNTYTFNNIAPLISQMIYEKKNGKASPNWNKVLLIPVDVTSDASGNVVKMNHDFSMSSAKLVGGKNDKVKMEVIYSRFSK